jgi:hypothetical protein
MRWRPTVVKKAGASLRAGVLAAADREQQPAPAQPAQELVAPVDVLMLLIDIGLHPKEAWSRRDVEEWIIWIGRVDLAPCRLRQSPPTRSAGSRELPTVRREIQINGSEVLNTGASRHRAVIRWLVGGSDGALPLHSGR